MDYTGELPLIEGTLIRLEVDRLPAGDDPLPVWLWSSATGLPGEDVDLRWQAFSIAHQPFWNDRAHA
jgi:hypothetical protein